MILQAYIAFLAFTLIILITGYYFEIDFMKVTAFFFLFLFGLGMLAGNTVLGHGVTLEYEQFSNATHYNESNSTVTTPNYATYQNHTLGFYIAILGAVGFITVFTDRKPQEVQA